MSDNILLKIHEELCAIKELLARQPAAPAARPASMFATPSAAQAEIPQPAKIVDNPGDVKVFFGKNTGRPLSELTERSLEWYASVKEPKVDSSGRPFTPRPQEIALENAARQLYHTQKGSLAGAENRTERPAATTPPPAAAKIEEDTSEIPF
jgi:hypothetical protein